MHSRTYTLGLVLAISATAGYGAAKHKKPVEPSALDKYLQEALKQPVVPVQPSAGSLWSPASRLTNVGSDVRAAQVDDLVTIVVSEQASAVANGATKTARTSTAQSQVAALGDCVQVRGALPADKGAHLVSVPRRRARQPPGR